MKEAGVRCQKSSPRKTYINKVARVALEQVLEHSVLAELREHDHVLAADDHVCEVAHVYGVGECSRNSTVVIMRDSLCEAYATRCVPMEHPRLAAAYGRNALSHAACTHKLERQRGFSNETSVTGGSKQPSTVPASMLVPTLGNKQLWIGSKFFGGNPPRNSELKFSEVGTQPTEECAPCSTSEQAEKKLAPKPKITCAGGSSQRQCHGLRAGQ